jgi:DNA invertase Pin-like site-specific DNA recombinase
MLGQEGTLMIRAISYDRISTKVQAHGDGLRRQGDATRAYCKEKGVYLDEGFCLQDVGVSGFRGKNATHGALGMILDAARNGRLVKGTWLVVENLDRLSRLPLDEALMLFRELLINGLEIHCLMPRLVFTPESLKSLGQLLPALFSMNTAHEESAKKSERLREKWSERRRAMPEGRVTKLCPKWLRPTQDGKGFEPIPKAVATVRLIYRYAIDGLGAVQIAKRLNRDKVPPIGRGDHWGRNYVTRILRWRAVLGEHQPCVMHDRRPVPEGEPIRGYYPPIISEKDWYAAQHAIDLRRRSGGRRGEQVTNLFTGLIYDARDGQRMIARARSRPGQQTRLVSSGAVYGVAGSSWAAFPYPWFEDYFLFVMSTKEVPNLLAQDSGKKESEIAAVMEKLGDTTHFIQMTKEKLKQRGNRPALLEVLADADEEKEKLSKELERLRGEQATSSTETLGEARSLFTAMRQCPPEQLPDLRSRLKQRLKTLIQAIWVLIEGDRTKRVAHAQVFFKDNDRMIFFSAAHPPRRGKSIEEGSDGQRRVSTTQFPSYVHGWVFAAADLPPDYDLRTWRERRQRPDLGGNWVQRKVKAGEFRFTPLILIPREPQPKAKRRRPVAD